MAEGVLGAILERKRRDVAARLDRSTFAPEPTSRSLKAALDRPGARFILEVKKASPSGHRSPHSVEQAVTAYAPVADAISVLTDAPFFGGSLDDLCTVRSRFDGPILAKDFIVDPRQVTEARAHGADAVLAIMAALSDEQVNELLAEARRLAMDVLVEVHDETELRRAIDLGAPIIGINNRDLVTLQTDLGTTERLAPMVPPDRTIVSESGIRDRSDVERIAPIVDAFLVGSSLMAAEDVGQAARRLLFGSVKVCGLTSAGDIRRAATAGATHAGFIFVPGTPRLVDGQAATLVVEASGTGLQSVGVFRGQPMAEICTITRSLDLDAVQLHDCPVDPESLRAELPADCEIWGVSGVGENTQPPMDGIDRILFDTRQGTTSGGSGRAFDWSRIAGRDDLSTAFLAGGIGPDNVRSARAVGTFGLDVGSKIEASPGKKDPQKLRDLFDALRPDCRSSARCD